MIRPTLTHLRRHPGFAAGAAISLGLGMALATTVFSMVDALYLRPLPFDQPDRLVRMYRTAVGARTLAGEISAPDLVVLRGNTTALSDVAAEPRTGCRPRRRGAPVRQRRGYVQPLRRLARSAGPRAAVQPIGRRSRCQWSDRH